ncbi:pentatricopeptide repeat-containing protein At2g13600-like [Apium graveolens]|uniref:pentatricopeptide repeat-containing protein At2g13600-like n=1 Tax=Apium graveolens TaxID=4045 RepID=UPI003D7972F0
MHHYYTTLFTHCIKTQNLNLGQQLHSHLIKTSLTSDIFYINRLIDIYCKCNSLHSALKAFDELSTKNTHSWNTIISGFSRIGCFDKAYYLFDQMPGRNVVSYNLLMSGLTQRGFYAKSIDVFRRMQSECGLGFMDEFSLVNVAHTCACLGELKLLKLVHGAGIVIGLEFGVVVCNALVDAYGKCDDPDDAYLVFSGIGEKDIVSWTSMVVGYARASRLDDACLVFDQMPVKNTVSWTALIAGFAQNGQGSEALGLFEKMMEEGIIPSAYTYVSVLNACADLTLIDRGKQVHGYITRRNNSSNINNLFLSNSLIDMYCKCGDMASAIRLFESSKGKDIITWNAIITGFAQNGHGHESVSVFKRMLKAKVMPNHVTFLGVLSACSHGGLLGEALTIFCSMERDFGVIPRSDHCAALIDVLGRKNRLKEALQLILTASKGSDHVGIWGALLAACQVHGNLGLAEKAAKALFELEPMNSGRYVMLSNIYAAAGKWDDANQVRELMTQRGLWKNAALSWIDIRNIRHEFVAKDKCHNQIEQIYKMLDILVNHMTDFVYPIYVDLSLIE